MRASGEETIAALSTPAGESGIAVVRLSGPRAFDILSAIFATPAGQPYEHRRLYHGHIIEGDDTVDEVMCAVVHGPDSYTGEDTVEISCHGNTVIVSRILNMIYRNGARAAEAGEFTKRAFLNGKLDLIQAEAVADLIHAKSELQQRVAQKQLAGGLSQRIDELADDMLGLLGNIEANIDFIEADIDTLDVAAALTTLARHGDVLEELLKSAAFAKPFHEGYRVAIAGPVNAGKSSLFNCLIGERRAIVTEIPGTTRDVLREPLVIEGLVFLLHDTAGLRGTEDHIERIGVGLAKSTLSDSDIVVFVLDASRGLRADEEEPLRALPESAIVVLNKSDLEIAVTPERVREVVPHARIVVTSVETGEGLDALNKTLIECVGRDRLNWIARERVVLNARLASTLQTSRHQLDTLAAGLREGAPMEILAHEARACLQLYESATGKRYSDDLLDTIFSRFCIGK